MSGATDFLAARLWIIANLNPDGVARRTRQNARGVDLNRNFPSEWQANGERGSPEYFGPRGALGAGDACGRPFPAGDQRATWFHQPEEMCLGAAAERSREPTHWSACRSADPVASRGERAELENRRVPPRHVTRGGAALRALATDRHIGAVIALANGAQ